MLLSRCCVTWEMQCPVLEQVIKQGDKRLVGKDGAVRGKMEWLSPPDWSGSSEGSPSPLPEDLRVNFNSRNLISHTLFEAARPSAASTLTPGAPTAVSSA